MRGYQKLIAAGNIAGDVKERVSQAGIKQARFTLAIERAWRDKGSGEVRKHTDFLAIICWGSLADIITKYGGKGKPVIVEGRVQTREYNDPKTNEKKFVTEIIAENIILLPTSNPPNANNKSANTQSKPVQESFDYPEDLPRSDSIISDIPF